MKHHTLLILILAILAVSCVPVAPSQPASVFPTESPPTIEGSTIATSVPLMEEIPWPTNGWTDATPESQGMDSVLLAEMLEDITANDTRVHSVLIVRNGYMVTEAYFQPYTRETKIPIQSVTKSVIGMLVGHAIDKGQISSVEDTVVSYFPGRVFPNASPEKFRITLAHLLSMSSGLNCEEFRLTGPRMEQTNNWVAFMLDLPMLAAPGTKFGYCNGNPHLLSVILEKETGINTREYANQELFAPLGIAPVGKEDWGSDPKGYTMGGYGLWLRPVDMARLGFLYLEEGRWGDEQIVPAKWVETSTRPIIPKGDGTSYGYLWTVYPGESHYSALGMGGQQIHVFPDRNLVVVMTSTLADFAESPTINRLLEQYVLPAVKAESPLPENETGQAALKKAVEWAAKPVSPVGELPPFALEVSGKTIRFGENPAGWREGIFEFVSGSDTAGLRINGSEPLEIGMDQVYRLSNVGSFGELFLKGDWVGDQTFQVDYPYPFISHPRLGDLGDVEIEFRFEGKTVKVTIRQLVFGSADISFEGIIQ